MNGGFSWFNSDERRIADRETGISSPYWLSTKESTKNIYLVSATSGSIGSTQFVERTYAFRPACHIKLEWIFLRHPYKYSSERMLILLRHMLLERTASEDLLNIPRINQNMLVATIMWLLRPLITFLNLQWCWIRVKGESSISLFGTVWYLMIHWMNWRKKRRGDKPLHLFSFVFYCAVVWEYLSLSYQNLCGDW